jgi:hypothetical protein
MTAFEVIADAIIVWLLIVFVPRVYSNTGVLMQFCCWRADSFWLQCSPTVNVRATVQANKSLLVRSLV